MIDGPTADAYSASALIHWAECDRMPDGYHLLIVLTMGRYLSDDEGEAFVSRVRAEVPGVAGIRRSPFPTSVTIFGISATRGNATIEGARRILERIACQLQVELTHVEDEESPELHVAYAAAVILRRARGLGVSDPLFQGLGDFAPFARRALGQPRRQD